MILLCETCGTETESDAPPESCVICTDERQYVGARGQRWITMEELARGRRIAFDDDAGVMSLRVEPSAAIGQRAAVIPTPDGNVLWECLSLVTTDAIERLARIGGIARIAISHPHFYAAMVSWSNALGGVPIVLHEADRQWVRRSSPCIEFWSGDSFALAEGVTLLRCGGHFDGSTVLHWNDGPRGGVLFSGDALQVTADRRHVSFMYSYPNYIPLHPDEVRSVVARVADVDFVDVYGYETGRNILGDGKAAVARSVTRYLRAVGATP